MPEMNFKLIDTDTLPRAIMANGATVNLTTVKDGSPDVVTAYSTTIANGEAVFSDAAWVIGAAQTCVLASGGKSQVVQAKATINAQLASGHYVASQFAMEAIHPRPDSETGSYSGTVNARHRWAYYDGTNKVRYEVPVKVFGGSAPHVYRIVTGPVDATIGKVYDGNGFTHSVISWVPDKAYSTSAPVTFLIRVTDQAGATLDITWTVATSVTKFMFIGGSGASNSNAGTFAAPFATLAKVTGASSNTVTYPDKIIYLRTGAYATAAHSDFPNACLLRPGKQPFQYITYPDEVVSIAFAAAEISMDDSACDLYISGSAGTPLRIIGSSNGNSETHNFWLGTSSLRSTFAFVDFDGFIPRVAGGFTNSVPIFAPGSNTSPSRKYLALHCVNEINRTASSSNDGMLCILFGIEGVAMEYCSATRTGGPGVSFKDTCYKTSARYCTFRTDSEEFAFAWMCQHGSANQEICYSRLEGRLRFNLQGASPELVGKHAEYRNAVYVHDANYDEAILGWPGDGPYLSINTLVTSKNLPAVGTAITATGTEGHVLYSSSNKPFNTTTLNLEDVGGGTAWRTLYLGTRGPEIL